MLAQIVQIEPIHVGFAPTERDRLDVLRGAEAGRLPLQREGVPITLRPGDGSPYPYAGVVDSVAPTLETMRGTIAVRALVPNLEGAEGVIRRTRRAPTPGSCRAAARRARA